MSVQAWYTSVQLILTVLEHGIGVLGSGFQRSQLQEAILPVLGQSAVVRRVVGKNQLLDHIWLVARLDIT